MVALLFEYRHLYTNTACACWYSSQYVVQLSQCSTWQKNHPARTCYKLVRDIDGSSLPDISFRDGHDSCTVGPV